jgi:hypothetical protein
MNHASLCCNKKSKRKKKKRMVRPKTGHISLKLREGKELLDMQGVNQIKEKNMLKPLWRIEK